MGNLLNTDDTRLKDWLLGDRISFSCLLGLVLRLSRDRGVVSLIGAPFPSGDRFDTCINVQETVVVRGLNPNFSCVQISKHALQNQNRRFAENDVHKDGSIISSGTTIKAHHVMVLISLGISCVMVYRYRGSELV